MRKGDWYLTYTGRQFWPLDPQPADIEIRDIAHHLSLVCRFNGSCRAFYSVAQHSLMVCDILPQPLKFYGLLHDASEAYLGDMIRPLKVNMPEYRKIEDLVTRAINAKFSVSLPESYENWIPWDPARPTEELVKMRAWEHVKHADNVALMTERRDLLVMSPQAWSTKQIPLPEIIQPLSPRDAEQKFLERFDELQAQRA